MSDTEASLEPEALETRIAILTAENRRLRERLEAGRHRRYRRTGLGLAAVGGVALLVGIVLPNVREVLFALAGIGAFAAVLTWYLTPERVVSATVGERVYGTLAANGTAITESLGLRDQAIYLPPTDRHPCRLYVPRHSSPRLPMDSSGPFVIDEDARGLLLEAVGGQLSEEVVSTESGDSLPTLAARLAEGLVESLEIADSADPEATDDRMTVAVSGSAFGPVDRFDHPVGSFLAAGLATALDRPVVLEVTAGTEADWLVTCSPYEGD